MKRYTLIALSILATIGMHSQSASQLSVHDTRSVNDAPNFNKQSIRADFKQTNVIGIPGTSFYSASITVSPWADGSAGNNYQLNFNESGINYRQGNPDESAWRPWKKLMIVNMDGSVSGKFEVNGTIRAREVKIESTGWADFVFDKNYDLPSLKSVEQHITKNRHLVGIPTEKDVKENGVDVAEMQVKLLQKVEELTLYAIQQEKRLDEQEKLINQLKTQLQNK